MFWDPYSPAFHSELRPAGSQDDTDQGSDALFGLLFKWKQDTQFLQPDYLSQAYQNSQKNQNRKREKQLFICTQLAWWSENRGRLEEMNLALSHQQSRNQIF